MSKDPKNKAAKLDVATIMKMVAATDMPKLTLDIDKGVLHAMHDQSEIHFIGRYCQVDHMIILRWLWNNANDLLSEVDQSRTKIVDLSHKLQKAESVMTQLNERLIELGGKVKV
jgi:hypothetical protein